jgi:hypothetical protein
MKLLRALLLCCLAVCSSFATDTLTINSAQFNDGTEYLAPYNSTLAIGDALVIPEQTFCIDLYSTVGFGQAFDVTVLNLQNYQGNERISFWEAGWLALQTAKYDQPGNVNLNTLSLINRAIWYITSPNPTQNPYLNTPDVAMWVQLASVSYTQIPQNDITLYLKDGDVGQSQISVVPEPSVFAISCIGFLALIAFRRYGRASALN